VSVFAVAMARRFDPGAAGDLRATFELVLARSDARYAVRVEGGRCQVTRGSAPEAGARVRISVGDLILLVSRRAEWTTLLAQGRLELGGDPFLALRFPQLFGVGPRR
jgi:predicted lipid carrier protein YhbT